jgi:TolB protein
VRRLGRQGCAVVAVACVLGVLSATPAGAVGHERILFARGPEFHTILSLHTARPDGTHLRLLTDDSMFGTISPNGKVVAYTAGADHDVQTDVFTIPIGGGPPTRITRDSRSESDLAWSPDGRSFAFTRVAHNTDIFTMRSDGSHPLRLTRRADMQADPTWSPDGGWIAFTSAGISHGNIWVMRADGSRERRVTHETGGVDPEWSPDGKRIVFVGRGGDLYTIRPDGTHARRLAGTSKSERDPSWSPDSRHIIYGVHRENDESQEEFNVLFTMRADGTHRVRFRPGDDSAAMLPDWGPA